ncbi:MAG: hypothetical protein CMJ45_05230 [Planctomyces sp.]|jgi:hypothetical protein|nr:hypothetical protein [Planctomyces sp.]
MIKRRNMLVQILLFIVTLGIYGIYWFYATSKEMVEYKKLDGSPILWTILLFIPFGSFFSLTGSTVRQSWRLQTASTPSC